MSEADGMLLVVDPGYQGPLRDLADCLVRPSVRVSEPLFQCIRTRYAPALALRGPPLLADRRTHRSRLRRPHGRGRASATASRTALGFLCSLQAAKDRRAPPFHTILVGPKR